MLYRLNLKFPFAIFVLANMSIPIFVRAQKPTNNNFSFEELNNLRQPVGWQVNWGHQNDGYIVQIDSLIKHDGKYSLKIEKISGERNFGGCAMIIPANFTGKKLILSGFIKADKVSGGLAGIALRIDDANMNILQFDNMKGRSIQGSTNWTEYTIALPYDAEKAKSITLGASLTGSGTIWVDELKLIAAD